MRESKRRRAIQNIVDQIDDKIELIGSSRSFTESGAYTYFLNELGSVEELFEQMWKVRSGLPLMDSVRKRYVEKVAKIFYRDILTCPKHAAWNTFVNGYMTVLVSRVTIGPETFVEILHRADQLDEASVRNYLKNLLLSEEGVQNYQHSFELYCKLTMREFEHFFGEDEEAIRHEYTSMAYKLAERVVTLGEEESKRADHDDTVSLLKRLDEFSVKHPIIDEETMQRFKKLVIRLLERAESDDTSPTPNWQCMSNAYRGPLDLEDNMYFGECFDSH